jgi:very-short-patch-repair endonuclease
MHTSQQVLADVRRLRREQTEAESLLWQQLRARRLKGAKFRRQHPIGEHIVDFCCLKHQLVIEVDGGQPAEETEKDAARTARLEAHGFKVIRFWNDDVLRNLEGVLTSVAEALRERGSGDAPADSEAESQR